MPFLWLWSGALLFPTLAVFCRLLRARFRLGALGKGVDHAPVLQEPLVGRVHRLELLLGSRPGSHVRAESIRMPDFRQETVSILDLLPRYPWLQLENRQSASYLVQQV